MQSTRNHHPIQDWEHCLTVKRGEAELICQTRLTIFSRKMMLVPHDDAHNAFMTLPPYISTIESEGRQLGSGPEPCRVDLRVMKCPHDSSYEHDARVPGRSANCCESRSPTKESASNMTAMMKEEQQWVCYGSYQTAGMIACSGMNRTRWPVILKRWQRFVK